MTTIKIQDDWGVMHPPQSATGWIIRRTTFSKMWYSKSSHTSGWSVRRYNAFIFDMYQDAGEIVMKLLEQNQNLVLQVEEA